MPIPAAFQRWLSARYQRPSAFWGSIPLFGEENLLELEKPTLITEDFSFYQQRLPGLFFFLGIGGDQPLHSDCFQFDEWLLLPGLALFQKLLCLSIGGNK